MEELKNLRFVKYYYGNNYLNNWVEFITDLPENTPESLLGKRLYFEEHILQEDNSIEVYNYPSNYVTQFFERILPNTKNIQEFVEAQKIAEGNHVAEIWKINCELEF